MGPTCTIRPVLQAMVSDSHLQATGHPAAAVSTAGVTVAQRCYRVGQKVKISGSGFLAGAPYDIAVDGVDFGQSVTDSGGAFATSLIPGGLGSGSAQIADTLSASDGAQTATAKFTVTRGTGALFGAGNGTSPRRLVPFEVWDFAPRGPEVAVYLHYVTPGGTARRTLKLGTTSGQCGLLISSLRDLFPFNPGKGTWTMQFDTAQTYSATPAGKVARLRVVVG